MRKRFLASSVGVLGVMLTGCSSVHESDGSSRLVLGVMRENNQRTRAESTWGKGGWDRNPDTHSLYRGNQPSAAVMQAFGRRGPVTGGE